MNTDANTAAADSKNEVLPMFPTTITPEDYKLFVAAWKHNIRLLAAHIHADRKYYRIVASAHAKRVPVPADLGAPPYAIITTLNEEAKRTSNRIKLQGATYQFPSVCKNYPESVEMIYEHSPTTASALVRWMICVRRDWKKRAQAAYLEQKAFSAQTTSEQPVPATVSVKA